MFTFDAVIDAVQTGKKTFVNTVVTNETAKDAMIKFVDAQTKYTKDAAKVGMDTLTVLTTELTKSVQNMAKVDYAKLGEGFAKAYTASTK